MPIRFEILLLDNIFIEQYIRAFSVESTHHTKLTKSVENLRRHNINLNLKIWGKCKRVIKIERSKLFPLLALKLLLLSPLHALILPFLSSQPI